MKTANVFVGAALGALSVLALSGTAAASSHREAPAIATDPAADNCDVWAWADDPTQPDAKVKIVATYIPLEEPSGGPNYFEFSPDVLYQLHIARGDASLDDVLTVTFKFSPHPVVPVDPASIGKTTPLGGGVEFFSQLTNLPNAAEQSYTATFTDGAGNVLATVNGTTPIDSIGPRTQKIILGQATQTKADYETYALTKIVHPDFGSSGMGNVFAGQRDDGFYVDLSGAFDLGNFRVGYGGASNPPKDNLAGYNTHAIAVEIPWAAIPAATGSSATYKDRLGVWASASRRKVKILRNDGSSQWIGPWVQVSRLGLPLINELVIGYQDKDKYNRTQPKDDVANFAPYILSPTIVRDAIAVGLYSDLATLLGNKPEAMACNNGMTDCATGRTDIVAAINIGDPNFPSAVTGDVIRIDPHVTAVKTFPNGRPLPDGAPSMKDVDDVTDILASVALYGFPSGIDGTSAGAGNPFAPLAIGDGVSANDAQYPGTFPYLPTPWRGWDEGHNK